CEWTLSTQLWLCFQRCVAGRGPSIPNLADSLAATHSEKLGHQRLAAMDWDFFSFFHPVRIRCSLQKRPFQFRVQCGCADAFPHLLVFPPNPPKKTRHASRPAFFRCKEARSQRYILYVPAAEPETGRQVIEIDLFIQWHLLWPDRFPDAPPA